MYLLALINTNLGPGGVAYYLYRKAKIPFLEALGWNPVHRPVMEMFPAVSFFDTRGDLLPSHARGGDRKSSGLPARRVCDEIAWLLLCAIVALFALAHRETPR